MGQVVISGMGCVSALGASCDAAWSNLVSGRGGIRRSKIPAEGQPNFQFEGMTAPVTEDPVDALSEYFPRKSLASVDRFSALAAMATAEAVRDAGFPIDNESLRHAAVLYGSASGGNGSIEAGYQRLFDAELSTIHPLTIPRYMTSAAASHLSMLFGVRGLCFSISSACASSAHAIAEGMHLIRSGRAKVVIAGGSDASLTYGSLQGWRALQAISEDTCRPFSVGRTGTVIGEGAATVILEEEEHASARGARIHAVMAGAGATSDAAHLTQPDSQSAAAAILAAHDDAGQSLEQPLLISAHGTGTVLNDRAETSALRRVYGTAIENSTVIATKSAHGHTLGAAGAMEFILALLAMENGVAPPVLGYLGRDPDCDLPLATIAQPIDVGAVLSTSFAFGGLNCALIARRHSC